MYLCSCPSKKPPSSMHPILSSGTGSHRLVHQVAVPAWLSGPVPSVFWPVCAVQGEERPGPCFAHFRLNLTLASLSLAIELGSREHLVFSYGGATSGPGFDRDPDWWVRPALQGCAGNIHSGVCGYLQKCRKRL